MTKYAIILASALALVGCKSGSGDRNQGSMASANGASNPDDYYGRSIAPDYRSSSGTMGTSSMGSSTSAIDQAGTAQHSSVQSASEAGMIGGADALNRTGQATSTTGNSDQSHIGTPGIGSTDNSLDQSSTSAVGSPAQGTTGTATSQGSSETTSPNQHASDQATTATAPAATDEKSTEQAAPQSGPTDTGTATASSVPQSSAPAASTASGTTAGTLGMSASDQAVTQSVTNSLAATGIAPQTLNNIHVRSMNGRVILTGQVNSQDEKQKVEAQVRRTPGVRTIINQLRVASGSSANPAAGVGGAGAGLESTGTATQSGSGTTGNQDSQNHPDSGTTSGPGSTPK